MIHKLKRLNNYGVAHHALLAILVVVAFASFGAYRVFNTKAYNFNGTQDQTIRKADGCVPGKHVKSGNCQKFSEIATIQKDCTDYKVQYDATKQECKDACKTDFKKYYGECVPSNFNTSAQPDQMKASCDTQHRQYDASTNSCRDTCVSGWYWQNNKCNATTTTGCPSGQVKINGACETKLTCTAPNTVYKADTNQCVCKSGYSRVNGDCKQDPTPTQSGGCPSGYVKEGNYCVDFAKRKSCQDAHRPYTAATNTCEDSCVDGWYKKDNKLPCVAKSSTSTPSTTTTSCRSDEVKVNGNCQKKVTCSGSNIRYEAVSNSCKCDTGYNLVSGTCKKDDSTSKPKTNGCSAGEIKSDNYCVTEKSMQTCDSKNLKYDKANDKCTDTCKSTHAKQDGRCVKKVECSGTNIVYDSATNSCKCTSGFTKDGKYCVNQKVRQQCDVAHQQFDRSANKCSENCLAGWYKKDGKLPCVQTTKGEGGGGCPAGLVRNLKTGVCQTPAQCAAAGNSCAPLPPPPTSPECNKKHMERDIRSNGCSPNCLPGYTMKKATCVPSPGGDPIDQCATLSPKPEVCVRADCANQHLVYQSSSNTCLDECVDGYTMEDGVCVEGSSDDGEDEATPEEDEDATLEGSCATEFLEYDPETNQCTDECVAGYAMQDGICVDEAEVDQNQMSEPLCEALGRDWVASDNPDAAAACATDPNTACLDSDSVYVPGSSDTASYCEGGDLGVDTEVPEETCDSEHHIYLDSIGACSSNCEGGWYADDSGCSEMWQYDFYESNNGDGESIEGGCLYGAEPLDDETCDEDTDSEQQDTEVLAVDTNIDEETCELMGRSWEPHAEDENGDEISGCSVDVCINDDIEIVEQDNGKPFCKGYIAKIDQSTCEELHRKWVDEADGCANRPSKNDNAGAKTVKAIQCEPPFSTYVTGGGNEDECVKPSFIGKLKGIAKNVGSLFSRFAHVNKAVFCNVQPTKHWNGKQCSPDKVAEHSSGLDEDSEGTADESGLINLNLPYAIVRQTYIIS